MGKNGTVVGTPCNAQGVCASVCVYMHASVCANVCLCCVCVCVCVWCVYMYVY